MKRWGSRVADWEIEGSSLADRRYGESQIFRHLRAYGKIAPNEAISLYSAYGRNESTSGFSKVNSVRKWVTQVPGHRQHFAKPSSLIDSKQRKARRRS